MSNGQHVTIDHEKIKEWAKKYRGTPQIIGRETEGNVGVRIDFPGKQDDLFLGESEKIKKATWEEFFEKFEEQNLAFLYSDSADPKDPSWSYRFIPRDSLQAQ